MQSGFLRNILLCSCLLIVGIAIQPAVGYAGIDFEATLKYESLHEYKLHSTASGSVMKTKQGKGKSYALLISGMRSHACGIWEHLWCWL